MNRSVAGLRGLPGSSVYSASKAAMQVWLEGTRGELSGRGIVVTTVNPGFVATPLVEKNRFWMPFLMTPEKAAAVIAKGVEARARVVEFPLRMRGIPKDKQERLDALYRYDDKRWRCGEECSCWDDERWRCDDKRWRCGEERSCWDDERWRCIGRV